MGNECGLRNGPVSMVTIVFLGQITKLTFLMIEINLLCLSHQEMAQTKAFGIAFYVMKQNMQSS